MEQTVSLQDILDARDRRVCRQKALLAQFRCPLISFTMNIAGPIKNTPLIHRGFLVGCQLLEGQFVRVNGRCLHKEIHSDHTGHEALYAVVLPPAELKQLTVELEDYTDMGRLFDMDVLDSDGNKIPRRTLGLQERTCLLCEKPAYVCARTRAHSVSELQEKTRSILQNSLAARDAEEVAQLACRALLYEICTTPKPGLVDCLNSGSHKDMDIFTFMDSTATLWPYFARCVRIGQRTSNESAAMTFRALRAPGKLAENMMFSATKGINTHKGAIFSFGVICAALGRLDREEWHDVDRILKECADMAEGLVAGDFSSVSAEKARTNGERLYLDYGITGIRGQVEAGFPSVSKVGLPKLKQGLALGKTLNESGCAALLAIIADSVDTNLVRRSDLKTQQQISKQIAHILCDRPFPDQATLEELDSAFIRENLSPGGSADLLAVCYFLYFLNA